MYTLMFADADKKALRALTHLLDWNKIGFECVCASENGQEALEAASILMPDVLITETRLPFLDGLSLARELQIKSPLTKVIFLTGEKSFESAQEAVACHAEQYLVKPTTAEQLEPVLQRLRESLDKRPMTKIEILDFLFNGQQEDTLFTMIQRREKEAAANYIEQIFRDMTHLRASLSDYQMQVVQIFFIIAKSAKRLVPDFDLSVENNLSLIMDIFRSETSEEIKAWLKRLCGNIIDYIASQTSIEDSSIASRGYTYLNQHYAEPGLSLKTVSDALHISSNYFSSVFKKSIGDSFTNVLIQIRMEQARQLILSSRLKVLEIAQAVGYTDSHYFSACFKKHFGMSPNEMRRSQ